MQVPQTISTWILDSFAGNKVLILIVVNIFLLFVGMVMDTTPAILILTPILLPIMNGVGVDSIHFGVMMVVNLAIGFVTPASSASTCLWQAPSQIFRWCRSRSGPFP